MPELPEVETFGRYIEEAVGERRIMGASCNGLPYCSESRYKVEELAGDMVVGRRRHGKALFLRMRSGRWLYIHFGMSGRPVVFDDEEPTYTRLRIDADGKSLSIQDPRRLGEVGVLDSPDDLLVPRRRGPDALSMGADELSQRLHGKRAVKAALMDQSLVCGVGNLYADEILFQNGILPCRRSEELSDEERKGIHRWMLKALNDSIAVGTDFSRLPEGMMLRVRERGGSCPRCLIPWKLTRVGGRTTYFCPSCQR